MNVLYLFLATIAVASADRTIGSRIYGGTAATIGRFPFAVSLDITKSTGKFSCSGALFTTKWILTAAQCVDGATSIVVTMGLIDLSDQSYDGFQQQTATTFIIYPEYDASTLANDVAVIQLDQEINYTFDAKPLNGFNPIEDGMTYAAVGWGQLNDDASSTTTELQYINVTAISNADCSTTYGSQLLDTMVCVKGDSTQSACAGDAGSPLTFEDFGVYYIVGIFSFYSANGCTSGDPSGFTRVLPYFNWISNVTHSHCWDDC